MMTRSQPTIIGGLAIWVDAANFAVDGHSLKIFF